MFALRRTTPVARFVRTKTSSATAEWKGSLKAGSGTVSGQTKAFVNAPYTFPSRFEADNTKTNPEELIGGAHASCYSMFLAALLSGEGLSLNPESVKTTAKVTLGDGPAITLIELINETKVSGIDEAKFQEQVQAAKAGCPITKALAGVAKITVEAKLVK